MKIIGKDKDGITQISLEALEKIKKQGYELNMVRIYHDGEVGTLSVFFFGDGLEYVYKASGFSIGYGGEGPHGIWKVFRMWYPDKFNKDFWNTEIPLLKSDKDWCWTSRLNLVQLLNFSP